MKSASFLEYYEFSPASHLPNVYELWWCKDLRGQLKWYRLSLNPFFLTCWWKFRIGVDGLKWGVCNVLLILFSFHLELGGEGLSSFSFSGDVNTTKSF